MIDLHCHILPEMDDGAQNLEVSEEMLRAAKAQGIDCIAATSHYAPEREGHYQESFQQVSALAEKIGIRLLTGCEYDMSSLPELDRKALRPLGETRYLLIDMNQNFISPGMVNLFFSLKLAGWKIVFAHPERMLRPDELRKLISLLQENDIMLQVDIGSVTGRYGSLARKNAFQVLDGGGCHFLGGDAHNPRHFQAEKCREIIEKRYGEGVFELLTEENPQRLLDGEFPVPMAPRPGFFRRLGALFRA